MLCLYESFSLILSADLGRKLALKEVIRLTGVSGNFRKNDERELQIWKSCTLDRHDYAFVVFISLHF